MLTSPIIPAIIPKSYADLERQVSLLVGLPEIHVDVVDGIFVPQKSWPYVDESRVEHSYELLNIFSLEVDLMVAKPLPAALHWLEAGADQLVFHIETITVPELEDFISRHDVTVGVSAHQQTPLSSLLEYLPFADYVQVMGIAQIGSQGQPFNESAIDRIQEIRSAFPNIPISIDGSVNFETLPTISNLKLDRYIVGSAIMSTDSPKDSYQKLTKIVSS